MGKLEVTFAGDVFDTNVMELAPAFEDGLWELDEDVDELEVSTDVFQAAIYRMQLDDAGEPRGDFLIGGKFEGGEELWEPTLRRFCSALNDAGVSWSLEWKDGDDVWHEMGPSDFTRTTEPVRRDSPEFPLGEYLAAGTIRIEEHLRGGTAPGQYRAFSRYLKTNYIVTLGGESSRPDAMRKAGKGVRGEGVARLHGYEELNAPYGGVFTALIEEEPQGRALEDWSLGRHEILQLGIDVADLVARREGPLGGIRPELLYLHERRFSGVIPRWIPFVGLTAESLDPSLPLFSVFYEAPELIVFLDGPTKASDVWSLCTLLATLLGGVHPFAGPTMVAHVTALTQAEPQFGELEPELAELLRRGLAREPEERLEPGELRDALCRFFL